jgi:hypothetical protein
MISHFQILWCNVKKMTFSSCNIYIYFNMGAKTPVLCIIIQSLASRLTYKKQYLSVVFISIYSLPKIEKLPRESWRKSKADTERRNIALLLKMGKTRDIDDLPKNPANYMSLTPLWFLERAATVHPTRTSIVHESVQYTWQETYQRCCRFASALSNRSLGLGRTVCTLLLLLILLFCSKLCLALSYK